MPNASRNSVQFNNEKSGQLGPAGILQLCTMTQAWLVGDINDSYIGLKPAVSSLDFSSEEENDSKLNSPAASMKDLSLDKPIMFQSTPKLTSEALPD